MEIFTIGYSSFTLQAFIHTLKEKDIKCLVDVRSLPYSHYHSEYNKEFLENELKKNGIIYRNYANEFGARQENPIFYGSDKILDFNKFINSEQFKSGVIKIKKGIDKGYSFAMMCAEKDPIDCHRAIMVGQGFKKSGFSVKHILYREDLETQEHLEQRLLDMYFKNRGQLSMFEKTESDEELIKKSYTLRNKKIGYKLDM